MREVSMTKVQDPISIGKIVLKNILRFGEVTELFGEES